MTNLEKIVLETKETELIEATTTANKFVSPVRLWQWFKNIILSRNNTWTGNNNFEKNVVIKGESDTVGNALELRNLNSTFWWEFSNDGSIIKRSNVNGTYAAGLQGICLDNIGNSNFGQFLPNKNVITFNNFGVDSNGDYKFTENAVSGMQATIGNSGNVRAGVFFLGRNVFIQTNAVNSGIYTNEPAYFSSSGFFGVNTRTPSGILDVRQPNYRDRDFTSLPYPRMTEAQRLALTSIPQGGGVYQTDAGAGGEGLYIYKSTGWTKIG
jgi:hypothetical protein